MKTSKYTGGSKIVAFRLPIASLSRATIEINAILKKYERDKPNKSKTTVKPTGASAKTTLAIKSQTKVNDTILYVCGCTLSDGLFRRIAGCKIERGRHTPLVGTE